MSHEEILQDAIQNPDPDKEPWYKGPISFIMGLFLLLLIVVWFIPGQAIKVDPEPKVIPTIEEVLPDNLRTALFGGG